MTAAQLLHFLIVIGLGILAFITFIVAATILGLMIVENSECDCWQYPVGLYVLGILGILFLHSAIRVLIDGPFFTWKWITEHREAIILALLIIFVLLIIL
jgi:hypothetical protein